MFGCLTDELHLSHSWYDDLHQQIQLPVHRVPGYSFLQTDASLRWGDSLELSGGRLSRWDLQWSLVQWRGHIVIRDIARYYHFILTTLEFRVRMVHHLWEVPVQLCWWIAGSWWRTGSSACLDYANWRCTTPPVTSCLSSVGSSGNVTPDTTRIRWASESKAAFDIKDRICYKQ